MKSEAMLAYKDILQHHEGLSSKSISQIDKDMHRSLPEHTHLNNDANFNALRCVLVAYSWCDPEIGYCQSMNFLVGTILYHLKEEDCFWLLRTITQKILPIVCAIHCESSC
jgi:hypothetical protein